ncbi:3-hydroxyacyl-ACP dehydratase FabZ [Desulfatitalea tepidiphila]|jgi:beta-hydroxyacyl-ACP dehydratase FabZ|uniref:3-hydroxyacyl-ACP dehydratase FabZ n=1 Tax=Desulfatitalea tepidiphila TaxID=1185843 RepID=UPI0006B48588|nr:3-hydroxyacyl-ACP dehydratase FabZ [Desulfatitalea tepidiphila]
MDTSIDIRKILSFLPHRYPFLLVDRVLECIPGQKIKALKNVTFNEPFFQGHFPETPIMPGVLIVEALAQAGGVLFMANREKRSERTLMYFMGLDKVKFRKPVVPGDQLILEVEIIKLRAKVIKLAGIAKVDDQVAAEAELMATFEE